MTDVLYTVVDQIFAGDIDPGKDVLIQAAHIMELTRPWQVCIIRAGWSVAYEAGTCFARMSTHIVMVNSAS